MRMPMSCCTASNSRGLITASDTSCPGTGSSSLGSNAPIASAARITVAQNDGVQNGVRITSGATSRQPSRSSIDAAVAEQLVETSGPVGCHRADRRSMSSRNGGHGSVERRPNSRQVVDARLVAQADAGSRSGEAASSPSAASVTAPCRFASRLPSGPSTSGTWAYSGSGRPSSRCRCNCRGVDEARSSPRTTWATSCAASSTTTARLYAGTPSLRRRTTSSTTRLDVTEHEVVEAEQLAVGAQPQRRAAAFVVQPPAGGCGRACGRCPG